MLMPRSANGAFDDAARLRDQGASVRVPFVHGCLLTTRSRTRGGLVCNLSVLGVYVTLDEPLPERGDHVHLLVQLPGTNPVLEADTVVTWQNRAPASGADSLPAGVGLRFVALAPVYKERVDGLVQSHQTTAGANDLVQPNMPHAGPRRVPCVQRCSFESRAGRVDTLLCNISRLGAYVTIDPAPEKGEAVKVTFEAPTDGTSLELSAVVAWRNPPERKGVDPLAPGCGVRFVDLSTEDERRLQALLER
jgi:Tfp pilus assembly protein PilZ